MGVLKEFICMAHGSFEAFEPHCPHGCKGTMIEREFRTAPMYPQRMTGIDRTLDNLAKDFNMTDMRHNSDGSLKASYGQEMNAIGKDGMTSAMWGKGGLDGLKQNGHQLGDSGLNAVQPILRKPENTIPANIKAKSALELK